MALQRITACDTELLILCHTADDPPLATCGTPSPRRGRLGNILCHITGRGRRGVRDPAADRPVALVAAVDAFLDRFRDDPGTRATYTETMRRLRETAGDQVPVAALTPELYEQTMARWDELAANTWNKHLSALTSFTAYCRRQDWLTTDPGRRLERRKVTRTRDKAIPRTRLDRLFTDDRNPLRERVLWRMLYETCARTEEILSLNVPDLDMEFRRALVVEKGGDRAYVARDSRSYGEPQGRGS